ncbi:MAG: metalloprotease [Halalkalicoccus sp.]|nr:metalloprotease [Halalkalicoccus sp.]
MSAIRGIRFGSREIRDLLIAWVALGVAFALFFAGGAAGVQRGGFLPLLLISMLTAGMGFLLHELAHKVVAVNFGQQAAFRADYGMLGLAVVSAMAGFIFAAPGAVYHRGRITERENGLIAVAGPVTNLALALLFAPLLLVPVEFVFRLGLYGVGINLLLAAFNMIPFGPLDGKTVLSWSLPVFLLAFGVSVGLAVGTAALFFL